MLLKHLQKNVFIPKLGKSFLLFNKPSLRNDVKFMSANSQFKEIIVDVP